MKAKEFVVSLVHSTQDDNGEKPARQDHPSLQAITEIPSNELSYQD
jgi:hypothetical protein